MLETNIAQQIFPQRLKAMVRIQKPRNNAPHELIVYQTDGNRRNHL